MTNILNTQSPASVFLRKLKRFDSLFFVGLCIFFQKILCILKIKSIFAVRQNHKIDCQSSDLTYKTADKAGLISGTSFGNNRCGSVARKRKGLAFYICTQQIFRPMRQNPKTCQTGNNSTGSATANARNSVLKPTTRTKSVPTITVTITGKRHNRFMHAMNKATYEFFAELTKGHSCAELRFVKKYEAASLLYPEDRKSLRGKTVKTDRHV
jgi:hypothetical protein